MLNHNEQRQLWILLFVLLLTSQRIEHIAAQPGVGLRFLTSYTQQRRWNDDRRQEQQNTTTTVTATTTTTTFTATTFTATATATATTTLSGQGEQISSDSDMTTSNDEPKTPFKDEDDTSVPDKEFFGIFQKLGTSWTTILKMMRSIVNNAGGKTMRNDIYVSSNNRKEGREWLLEQNNWEKLLQPYKSLYHDFEERTFEDVLDSFLRWAESDEAQEDQHDQHGECRLEGGINGQESKINVSKALRRLEKYATWMSQMENDLKELTASSIKEVFSIFSMKMSIDDCQRLVWWLDLGAVDWKRFEELEPKDVARMFVWISHYMLLNPCAQEQGLVLINSLNHIGFWPFMTMLPVDLGMQLNEFVISVIPIKTRFVVLLERPPWAKFAYQMLKPFMKSNMRRRVVVIEEGLYANDYLFEVVGTKAIPSGIGNYPGREEAEILRPYVNGKSKRWF